MPRTTPRCPRLYKLLQAPLHHPRIAIARSRRQPFHIWFFRAFWLRPLDVFIRIVVVWIPRTRRFRVGVFETLKRFPRHRRASSTVDPPKLLQLKNHAIIDLRTQTFVAEHGIRAHDFAKRGAIRVARVHRGIRMRRLGQRAKRHLNLRHRRVRRHAQDVVRRRALASHRRRDDASASASAPRRHRSGADHVSTPHTRLCARARRAPRAHRARNHAL
mmetsp:Transcript_303/g.1274  ORF Transcript_303/g.1274 Transcript_303/m.1274 type:complete len:217 (-) Transcript_303:87-737(-)